MNLHSSFPPVSSPDLLNKWIFETISPWVNGRLLEKGSTLNSISTFFIEKGRPIHLSTSDKALREKLKINYERVEAVRRVHSLNFHRLDFKQAYPLDIAKSFDTVLILNAMENGSYDNKVVGHAHHILRQRGRLILLAPIFTALYDGLQLYQNELKQYNRSSIRKVLADRFEILMIKYFTLTSDAGYDRTGQSVIIIARKK